MVLAEQLKSDEKLNRKAAQKLPNTYVPLKKLRIWIFPVYSMEKQLDKSLSIPSQNIRQPNISEHQTRGIRIPNTTSCITL